jgi:hypothetical protein
MTVVLRNQHPTLNDIHDKMRERILISDRLVDGIVYKCAEVAESVMMDAVLNTSKKVVTIKTVVSNPKLELVHKANGCGRYSCKCGNNHIYDSYNFCSKCGIEILWTNK